MEITIKQNITVTEQDIDDIVCTALEGGINYWCDNVEVNGDYLGEYASDQISRNGQLKFYVFDPVNDTDMFVLDKDNFIKGLRMYLEDPKPPYDITGTNHGKPVLDLCNCDAVVADMIIQYALFDEIVFG